MTKFCKGVILGFLLMFIIFLEIKGQTNSNNCTRIFKGVRSGGNIVGRLEIPVMDDSFPKFQLRLKFSRAIHHLTVRQLRARDVGSRREFLVDPMDLQQNGIIRINTAIRLNQIFGPSPRLIGVVYNGKLVCGENVFEDGVIVETQPTTKRSIPILTVTNKLPKESEEEDEVFK